MSDLLSIARQLKAVKGQRLVTHLTRFLSARPEQLAGWKGAWTEVNTAKVVEILRRRGVVEELEVAQTGLFGQLLNAAQRAPQMKE